MADCQPKAIKVVTETTDSALIKQLLDVKLDSSDAAIQLRATAAEYRDVDDNSMAFVIIEQCHDLASFRERWWKQVQRQTAG